MMLYSTCSRCVRYTLTVVEAFPSQFFGASKWYVFAASDDQRGLPQQATSLALQRRLRDPFMIRYHFHD